MEKDIEQNESILKILDGNFFKIHSKDEKSSVKANCERCPLKKKQKYKIHRQFQVSLQVRL